MSDESMKHELQVWCKQDHLKLMAPSSGPVLVVEPEYCPEAVIEWYEYTGDDNKKHGGMNRDLSSKARKHLSALGWTFWYADKKGRLELRYQSPRNGRSYNSLRTACKSCIEDGGCGPQNVAFFTHRTRDLVEVEPSSTTPISSSAEAHTDTTTTLKLKLQPRKCKKTRVQPRRCNKKRQSKTNDDDDDDDDSEWTPPMGVVQSQAKFDASSSSNKRGRVLRSSKRVRHVGDEAEGCSDSLLRKPRTVISWLIDNKVVILEAKVICRGGNNNVVKKGRLLRSGIACDCCGLVFSLTRFEAHAGCTKPRPAANIFLEDGRSLVDCQREALISQEKKMHGFMMQGNSYHDQNDNICSVCHYGGELMLCDRCPSSFHHSCLGLEQVPDGDWFCPPCCCKICNRPRYSEDCAANHVDNSVLVCDQCERKYHIGCLKTRGFAKLKNYPNENWFCNSDCENIFFSLQKLIGKPISVGADNLTWTLLKTMKSDNSGGGGHTCVDLEGLSQIESKLSVALGVMHECFEPIIDALTGRDIVADVIFSRGSEFNRLNFRGFYTVILERNDEVISVATLRIYGHKVAEVPLVATRRQFRRQGMCRILMNELEKQLIHFGVERMILPAAHDVVDTWTNSFGFATMTDADKYQFLDYTFLDFQESTMCHKPLKKPSMDYIWSRPCIEQVNNHLMFSFANCIADRD